MPPVPVYVKGGVWTNLEDQIVKAAIQKYGTHQWSKIASLLQRKTAKQCETRWNEYLNPKINFDEFSKEEDARLLDLARRLPNQWRTIADAMGRTAQICIDRYNKVMESDEHDTELSLGSSLEFKVGDLNLKSDTLAAKPDESELADDEREMLAEARARLLNTQGKKATRKIRERMLEESKRIAQLQKRRELKQAGIKTAIKQPKKRYATEIDYNKDIVYEQAPLPGIYDTSLEDERLNREFQDYKKKVDRRGIKNKESLQSDSTRRGKAQDDVLQVNKGNLESKILTDDYKKPSLTLPKPGARVAVVEEDVAIKKRKLLDSGLGVKTEQEQLFQPAGTTQIPYKPISLKELFARLPKPKNDFEIILDDEENEDELSERQNQSDNLSVQDSDIIAKGEDSTVALNLDCLKQSHLPTPSFTTNPADDFEQTFNELVATSMTKEEYLQPSEYTILLSKVEEQMKHIQIKPPRIPETWTRPIRSDIMDSIHSKRLKIADSQEQLASISSIVSQNDRISRKVCGEMLPRVRALQHRYYVNYRMYQDEVRGISARTERLKADLTQLEAS